MSEIILPVIEHATVNELDGRVEIRMDSGWVFYRTDLYPEGFPEEDISYFRYGVFSPQTDFTVFVIVDETTIPSNQIFGSGYKTETI